MYCKECNAYVNMQNGCCAECGAPLNANSSKPVQATPSKSTPVPVPSKAKIYCRECGTENEINARFCCECGSQMNVMVSAPVRNQVQEETKQISNDIVGKTYYFTRYIFSYTYSTTRVEFTKDSLYIKNVAVPYKRIRGFSEFEKINFGELWWVIVCAVGALCALAIESVLVAIVFIIFGMTEFLDSVFYKHSFELD